MRFSTNCFFRSKASRSFHKLFLTRSCSYHPDWSPLRLSLSLIRKLNVKKILTTVYLWIVSKESPILPVRLLLAAAAASNSSSWSNCLQKVMQLFNSCLCDFQRNPHSSVHTYNYKVILYKLVDLSSLEFISIARKKCTWIPEPQRSTKRRW